LHDTGFRLTALRYHFGVYVAGRRLEKRQAMAHGGDAKFLQRVSIQFCQMFRANRVLLKRIGVLSQPKFGQPFTAIRQEFLPRAAYMGCGDIAATSTIGCSWPVFP